MTHAHEEFEVGHEMDRALRAAVTSLAQLMERWARRQQEQTREAASRAREDWLGRRDAARQTYMPALGEGRLEKMHPVAASQRWAVAAAWSDMDPTARMAEQEMARRITAAHGQHPSVLVNFTDTSGLPPDPNPAAKLLSMNEAYGLAATNKPDWYTIPEGVAPLEQDRPPGNAVEEKFHDDWQYFSEAGALPERTQWEHWADHVGRGEEFTPEKWTTADGQVDHDARDDALAAVWEEGREQRTAQEMTAHGVAMHNAGMGEVPLGLSPEGEIVQNHPWNAYLTPSRFDAASPDELATAWRDASAASLTGDLGAKRSADKIATMMRDRRGLNPDSMLIGALTEQAAQNTEARRNAEDRARRSEEAARESGRTPSTQAPTTSSPAATSAPTSAAAQATPVGVSSTGEAWTTSRERVVELNAMAADYYAQQMRPGTPGHKYFTERLGEDFETAGYQLGYAPSGWQNLSNHLRNQGATEKEMLDAGLVEPGKFGVRDAFRDRAMIGIRDHETGETVGFLGRNLSDDERAKDYKVRNTKETPAFKKGNQVFGLREAQPGARLVRVEGPFDAMAVSLASEGKAAGVSTMGTAMTDVQARAIAERANGRVWLANDHDAGGQKATEEDFFKFSELGTDARQIDYWGSDPANAWQERPAMLRRDLEDMPQARSAAETVVDRYLADPNATRAGFDDVMQRVGPYVPDDIERQLLAVRGEELDRAQTQRDDAIGTEERTTGDAQRAEVSRVDAAEPSRLQRPDPSAPAAADPHPRSGAREERIEERETAENVTAQAEAFEAAAYDRRDEAKTDLSEQQAQARDGSSHGFSQSTQDQVQNAPQRRAGVQAKVQRGTGVQQTHGRTLRR